MRTPFSRPTLSLAISAAFGAPPERRTIDVTRRVLIDERSWVDQAVCAGAGVARLSDLTIGPYLSSGLLVPVLADWEAVDAPTIFAVYRPSGRYSKRVRVFVDFLVEVFAELEAQRTPAPIGGVLHVPQPRWFGRARGRQSAFVARGGKSAS